MVQSANSSSPTGVGEQALLAGPVDDCTVGTCCGVDQCLCWLAPHRIVRLLANVGRRIDSTHELQDAWGYNAAKLRTPPVTCSHSFTLRQLCSPL